MNAYTGQTPDTEPAADWRKSAACAGAGDDMFPGTNADDIDDAKAYCRRCPAVDRCLQWALETGAEFGVWGGLSEQERRKYQRRKPVRPINIDSYAGTRATREPSRPLADTYAHYTMPVGDHLVWTGPKTVYRAEGNITAPRLSFFLDRGRWPDGDTKRTCGVPGCVKPGHLNDRTERTLAAERLGAAS